MGVACGAGICPCPARRQAPDVPEPCAQADPSLSLPLCSQPHLCDVPAGSCHICVHTSVSPERSRLLASRIPMGTSAPSVPSVPHTTILPVLLFPGGRLVIRRPGPGTAQIVWGPRAGTVAIHIQQLTFMSPQLLRYFSKMN